MREFYSLRPTRRVGVFSLLYMVAYIFVICQRRSNLWLLHCRPVLLVSASTCILIYLTQLIHLCVNPGIQLDIAFTVVSRTELSLDAVVQHANLFIHQIQSHAISPTYLFANFRTTLFLPPFLVANFSTTLSPRDQTHLFRQHTLNHSLASNWINLLFVFSYRVLSL